MEAILSSFNEKLAKLSELDSYLTIILEDQQPFCVNFIPVQNGFCRPFFFSELQICYQLALVLTRSLTRLGTEGI